jgi:hypothetical protein
VGLLKTPTLGASYSVWQTRFQSLKQSLTLEVKVYQITGSEVPFPAQHIPFQGFNQHVSNLITGVNNWSAVQP